MNVFLMPSLLLKAANLDLAHCAKLLPALSADKYGIVLKSAHDSYDEGDVPKSTSFSSRFFRGSSRLCR